MGAAVRSPGPSGRSGRLAEVDLPIGSYGGRRQVARSFRSVRSVRPRWTFPAGRVGAAGRQYVNGPASAGPPAAGPANQTADYCNHSAASPTDPTVSAF